MTCFFMGFSLNLFKCLLHHGFLTESISNPIASQSYWQEEHSTIECTFFSGNRKYNVTIHHPSLGWHKSSDFVEIAPLHPVLNSYSTTITKRRYAMSEEQPLLERKAIASELNTPTRQQIEVLQTLSPKSQEWFKAL